MKSRLTLTLALLLLCTGAALAQTPDGETPAEETVCDSETGAAFGLCNAYCEAMDCDSDSPQASETACTKVKNKFMNIAGHDLPCEAAAVTCPCAALPEWDTVLSGGNPQCGGLEGIILILNTDVGSAAIDIGGNNRCSVNFTTLPTTPEQTTACVDLLLSHCPPET